MRELKHVIEQLFVLRDGVIFRMDDLPATINQRKSVFNPFSDGELPLQEIEKRYIRYVLLRTKGIRHQAASILGINRKTLSAKIKKYGLGHDLE